MLRHGVRITLFRHAIKSSVKPAGVFRIALITLRSAHDVINCVTINVSKVNLDVLTVVIT